MAVRPSDLHAIPLFERITEDHLDELMMAFQRQEVPAGHVLFEAGSEPAHLHLLVQGEVALVEAGETRFRLHPISPIGELGALTGLRRMTTAVTTQPSEIWRIGAAELHDFFEEHGDVAYPFYNNLLNVVAGKIRRDGRRIEEVRANLIRTQKAMKRLLELVLDSEETPLSKVICATLEELIERNRRSHYMVEPAHTLKSSVRLDNGEIVPVLELSDGWLRLGGLRGAVKGADWSGVLILPTREIPVIGTIDSVNDQGALVKLELLIDEYAAELQEYLTRLQMLDFVV
ncbi:cAMP-binding protein [Sorangium cellulosum]|uniref:cAMP-binding protein n=1 Tax=Sorangium cellulosum TaxID=56 RepID=A0A2L0FBE4_SORCE|nr:cyclic nucleotide-binding domain-containing protein [Sorangium cellulosum]AUX48926.1 cAMP-binding protein [Sorangium cellulosum]